MLCATSSAAVFWCTVPETYPLGLLSILLALVAVARGRRTAWFVLASAFTLSATVTNWMVGIVAGFARFRWGKALGVTALAFCLVLALWRVQKVIFPSVRLFLAARQEAKHMFTPESGGPLAVLKSFLFHSVVMPEIGVRTHSSGKLILTTQASRPGSASAFGATAVALWTMLLAMGLWGFFVARESRRIRAVLGLTLLGQLLLHCVYGRETFLYSLHFAPLLIAVTAFAASTRARPLALVLASALAILCAVNNAAQFSTALRPFQRAVGAGSSLNDERSPSSDGSIPRAPAP
jgi:hypothetical protein